MNFISKLSKEYAAAGNHFYPDERDVANAFEAGFLKAREIAVMICRETEERFGFQSSGNLDGWTLPKGIMEISLSSIGEERVG